jgi:hypothetical protein
MRVEKKGLISVGEIVGLCWRGCLLFVGGFNCKNFSGGLRQRDFHIRLFCWSWRRKIEEITVQGRGG